MSLRDLVRKYCQGSQEGKQTGENRRKEPRLIDTSAITVKNSGGHIPRAWWGSFGGVDVWSAGRPNLEAGKCFFFNPYKAHLPKHPSPPSL